MKTTRYILRRQIAGVDANPIAQSAVREPTVTPKNLPTGATVKISVQASNNAGKSAIARSVELSL